MRRIGCVRFQVFAGVILLILTVVHCTMAENLSINLDVAGNLDAQFHGLEISATIAGEVSLVGDIPHERSTIWFSAAGAIDGMGFRSILTLINKGWFLLSATGKTADGEPIDIRSLLYALRESLIPLKAGDLFEGVHHSVIQIGESINVYWGEFAGTLVGGLAPAETEGTLRLAGTGSFYLSGKWVPDASPADFLGTIPLDDPDLPAAFLQTIDEFFNLPLAQEPSHL
ncbi:hypothetical protein ACFLS0_01880 [Candidatus Bipolaricaulota bacterium]